VTAIAEENGPFSEIVAFEKVVLDVGAEGPRRFSCGKVGF
jgi:hypothetical protein